MVFSVLSHECHSSKPIEVSINQNAVMPAWFDVYGLTVEVPQDEKGIAKVAEQSKVNSFCTTDYLAIRA